MKTQIQGMIPSKGSANGSIYSTLGSPTEAEWEIIVRDDEAYRYRQSVVSSVQEYEFGNDPIQEVATNNPPMDPSLDFNVGNNIDYVQQNQ